MKKVIFLSIVVLFVGLYSGLWFYRAKVTERYLHSQITELEKTGMVKLNHTSRIEGFPFAFRVVLDDVHAEVTQAPNADGPFTVDVPNITATSNFSGDTYHITYKDLVVVQEGLPLPGATTEKNEWVTRFPTSEWHITFPQLAWRDMLDGKLDFNNAVAFDYQNPEVQMVSRNGDKEKTLLTAGPTTMRFFSEQDAKGKTSDFSLRTVATHSVEAFDFFKKISLDMDIQGVQPNDTETPTKLTVKHLALAADDISLTVKGEVQHSKADPQPTGKAVFAFINYVALLEKLQNQAEKEALETLFHHVADRVEGANATLTLSREPGNEAMIGKTPLSQAMVMYREALAKNQPPETSTPEAPKE